MQYQSIATTARDKQEPTKKLAREIAHFVMVFGEECVLEDSMTLSSED